MHSHGTGAQALTILQLKRAASAADLQLWAVSAFGFSVASAADFLGGGVVPDLGPRGGEDVAEGFEVALAGVHVAVGSYAHVDECGGAGFDA